MSMLRIRCGRVTTTHLSGRRLVVRVGGWVWSFRWERLTQEESADRRTERDLRAATRSEYDLLRQGYPRGGRGGV